VLDGGHVRRRSISSASDASPCVRIEKQKHLAARKVESRNKAFIVEKSSISSTTSIQFGGERMIKPDKDYWNGRVWRKAASLQTGKTFLDVSCSFACSTGYLPHHIKLPSLYSCFYSPFPQGLVQAPVPQVQVRTLRHCPIRMGPCQRDLSPWSTQHRPCKCNTSPAYCTKELGSCQR